MTVRRQVVRSTDAPTFELVVDPPVRVGISQRGADSELETRTDRHEAQVEEAMDVPAERQPVDDLVPTAVLPRSDVRRLHHWEGVLRGDGARATVGIENGEAEACLPESRPDELWLAEPPQL